MKKIQISVRDFALPSPRTGSIEVHSGYGALSSLGQEIHARFQNRLADESDDYQAEVPISNSFERDGYEFVISGRIDGLYPAELCLEEIKTTFNIRDLGEKLRENPDHPYCLQLKTYGYFYRLLTGHMPRLRFRLISQRDFEDSLLEIEFTDKEYEAWLDRRLDELVVETEIREKTERRRKKAAKAFVFPFPQPRPGQTELIATVEESMNGTEPLLLQAPTGLGKTVGVMYPALKEALSRGQKLIYVTPKNSQHSVAEDAVRRLQGTGAKVKALTINAKSKMCMKAEPICNPDYCEYARDYYTKIHEHGLVDKVARLKNLTPKKFRRIAEESEVCPFELQLETLDRVDAVICDYNYVFAPRNALGRLSNPVGKKSNKPNLIIDEAHNLPSRATGYYSPSLSVFVLRQLKDEAGRLPPRFEREFSKLVDGGCDIVSGCRPEGAAAAQKVALSPIKFMEHEAKIREFLNRYLDGAETEVLPRDPVVRLCNYWSEFTAALEYEGETFFTTFRPHHRGDSLKITCCDAAGMLKQSYESFAHVVAFSATVKPFDYYGRLSGFDPATVKTAEFRSPFPADNRKLLIIPQVSTKYNQREANYGKIATAIERITSLKTGNYFVFFPSFEFMERIAAQTRLPAFEMLCQQREMKAAEVRSYIEALKRADTPTVIFAVQGGVFSEGVDYPGDMVIGALIVGPALPSYDLERELLKDYYERHYGSGFDYAYTYPAMAKTVQSAGRVIRSEHDRGLIVLLDSRFVYQSYAKAMPSDWYRRSARELVSDQILNDIQSFWLRAGESGS